MTDLLAARSQQPELALVEGALLFKKGVIVTSVPYHLEQ
jgi:hypothetical protein